MAQRSLLPQEPPPPAQSTSQPQPPEPEADQPEEPRSEQQPQSQSQPQLPPQSPQSQPQLQPQTQPSDTGSSASLATTSIWRKLINRGANTGSGVPVKEASEPPASEPPRLPDPAFAAPETSPVLSPKSPSDAAEVVAQAEELPVLQNNPSGPNGSDSLGNETPPAPATPSPSAAHATDTAGEDGSAQKAGGKNRRVQRDVVANLPRAQTFTRQQSELRENLLPIQQTPDERRAASVDRRQSQPASSPLSSQILPGPRTSPPEITTRSIDDTIPAVPSTHFPQTPPSQSLKAAPSVGELSLNGAGLDGMTTAAGDDSHIDPSVTTNGKSTQREQPTYQDDQDQQSHQESLDHLEDRSHLEAAHHLDDQASLVDTASMTSSQYEHKIRYELEHTWILNLSMHFRDGSRREKFFVTYRQRPDLWRRVTISLDYRRAPENSLEMDLLHTKFQRDKNEKIYEAIRDSLVDIKFYNTVTNLKLETDAGRLNVHVVEDVTEIIEYPSCRMIQHLHCNRILERDIVFDSHMSGFVYKVRVDGRLLIKKDIPGPDSVDEFLYEVNALSFLCHSKNVIEFYGVIVDDHDRVKGLLISYAEQGALIDIIYENNQGIPWQTRIRWARQIIQGLSEIHEAGFVQGDFTLSNIVIDDYDNAKIIDINRRGCPVGWEPPEATPIIESNQRISMYIGVKSDLYQLGMVLWALVMLDDEPETHGRPLLLDHGAMIPIWLRRVIETCLSEDPRRREQASRLLDFFPKHDRMVYSPAGSEYDDGDWIDGTHQRVVYTHSAPSASIVDGDHRSTVLRGDPDGVDYNGLGRDAENYATGKIGDAEHVHNGLGPHIRTVPSPKDWSYVDFGHTYVDPIAGVSNEPYYYPTRGRSPPSPLPIHSNRKLSYRGSDQPTSTRQDGEHEQSQSRGRGRKNECLASSDVDVAHCTTNGPKDVIQPVGDTITDQGVSGHSTVAYSEHTSSGYKSGGTPAADTNPDPTTIEVVEMGNSQFDTAPSSEKDKARTERTGIPGTEPLPTTQISNNHGLLAEIKGIGAVYDEKHGDQHRSAELRGGNEDAALGRYPSIDDDLNAIAMG